MNHMVQKSKSQLIVAAEGVARAPAGAVWQLVSDATSYAVWGPWQESGYRQRGDAARDGAGAIRWFRYGRTVTVEEVLTAVRDRELRYTVVGGLPVRNYLAEVTLTAVEGGTRIEWSARMDRTIRGRIVHRALVRLYPEIMRRLIGAAERAVPAAPAA
jgi:hypothetical protein